MNFELGIKWYLVFLFSTVCHEAAHAWTAHRLGDDTAYRGGQVSLDPLPHIRRSPFGMVVIPIFSYALGGWMIGWASAPYSVEWARANPRHAATMAMAGPAANLILLLLSCLVLVIGTKVGWFAIATHPDFGNVAIGHGDWAQFSATLLSLAVSLNLLLFVFNLLPLPPLDGASLPLFFLNRSAAGRYMEFFHHPGASMLGLFLAWKGAGLVLPVAFAAFFNGFKNVAGLL